MHSRCPEDHPWHPSQVTIEKLEKFCAAIRKAADALWDRDEDGDLPVECHLLDRTRYQPYCHIPVAYDHHAETEEDHNQILGALTANLCSATERLDMYMRCRESSVRTGLDKDVRLIRNMAKVMAEVVPVKKVKREAMEKAAKEVLQWLQQRRFNWT
ncbi:hypothetical protein LCGC14_0399570 [marine sediment metagenome]|uniref:Uncharacterized protein n=1 Tax=marine sediment metagenome TaxID=412755 RepID=A0A0F9SX71_9ZZZZ